MKLLLTLQY